jgi:hypothetical protein
MTGANQQPPKDQPWYVRPRTVLPLLAILLVATVLFTPEPSAGNDDPRLSTYSAQSRGARLLFELADRLGWSVERTTSTVLPLDSSSTIAVLAPPVQFRAREVHDVLEHVRAGGSLLVVVDRGASVFADSLGLERLFSRDSLIVPQSSRRCPSPENRVRAYLAGERPGSRSSILAFTLKDSQLAAVDTLLAVRSTEGNQRDNHPVMLAARLGAGRVVITGATGPLTNETLRHCPEAFDIVAVRALEFLTAGSRTKSLVFDEYHQGFGAHAGSLPSILREFAGTRSGRMFFQLAGAGLLLLLAMAPRALPPAEPPPPDRRSPIEHVDALARAYQQVGATRTAGSRLVRGLRRRVEHGAVSSRAGQSDAQFLDHVMRYHPALLNDVTLLRAIVERDVNRTEWSAVPEALDRIERTLTRK